MKHKQLLSVARAFLFSDWCFSFCFDFLAVPRGRSRSNRQHISKLAAQILHRFPMFLMVEIRSCPYYWCDWCVFGHKVHHFWSGFHFTSHNVALNLLGWSSDCVCACMCASPWQSEAFRRLCGVLFLLAVPSGPRQRDSPVGEQPALE